MLRNEVKVKVFYFLSTLEDGSTTSVPIIARECRVNKKALSVLILRWLRWGYVRRKRFPREWTGEVYWYSLTRHGRKYLADLPRWNPLLASFIDTLQTAKDHP